VDETLTIAERFCGPPGAGNGGYAAGRLALALGGEAEVTIRRPLPLGRPLRLRRDRDRLEALDGAEVLAVALRATVELRPPAPLDLERARAAAVAFPRFVDHPVPRCFVCGPERADGLRIFPGRVAGREGLWAAPWTPGEDLAGDDGMVRAEHVWAALDCPGAFAVNEPPRGLALLGRIAARLDQPIPAGKPCIVLAWSLGADGRKLHPATAVQSADGELHAVARATWILTTSSH
jgi:hypothetical protein